jgi:hypothetical protein
MTDSDLLPYIQENNLKVLCLKQPYFPKQVLSIRFSDALLQAMGIDYRPQLSNIHGLKFGVVFKTRQPWNKKHAMYGTICEVSKTESVSEVSLNSQ